MTILTPARTEGLAPLREILTEETAPRVSRWRLPAGVAPYVMVLPALGLMAVFVLAPVLLAIVVALFEWDVLAGDRTFVGLGNFQSVWASGELTRGVTITLLYALMTVPTSVGLGLLAALAIRHVARGAALWQTVYFLPVAALLAAMAVSWRWLFFPSSGPIDRYFSWAVAGQEGWLNNPALALPALAVIGNWQGIAFATVLFAAGLSVVPTHLEDAARVDGANAWHRFWHVTWPALGPTTFFVLLLTTLTSLRVFDQVAVLTDGGPGTSTETLAFLMWRRGTSFLDLGGGAVLNLALIVLIAAVSLWQVRGFRRRLEQAGRR